MRLLSKAVTLLTLVSMLSSSLAFACDEEGKTGIMPNNNYWIGPDMMKNSNIDEKVFNYIIDRAEKVYAPIIAKQGAKLVVERKWNDGTVNAYAFRRGNNWHVAMFGGLARHPLVTPDGFAAVVCHELGHHLAGQPKGSWASNEGQSDYFATLKCMRKIYYNDDNRVFFKRIYNDDYANKACAAAWSNTQNPRDLAMCIRNSMAGLSLARLLNSLRRNPTPVKFDTPDTSVVSRTNHAHPQAQCRLDTYFNGSLCNISHEIDIDDARHPEKGLCRWKTGRKMGNRPKCWFKPPAGFDDSYDYDYDVF